MKNKLHIAEFKFLLRYEKNVMVNNSTNIRCLETLTHEVGIATRTHISGIRPVVTSQRP